MEILPHALLHIYCIFQMMEIVNLPSSILIYQVNTRWYVVVRSVNSELDAGETLVVSTDIATSDFKFVEFNLIRVIGHRPMIDFEEQIAALHNSINELNATTPLVLVGHSMGTFIVTRYADTYKGAIKHLVLISAPIYTEDDLNNPAFDVAIKMFRDAVSIKNRDVLETKAFNNSITNIVMNKENYAKLANVQTDATLIYGDMDKFISVLNYPKMLKKNPDHLVAIRTVGHHGVSREKYVQLAKVLKELIDA